MPSVLTSSLWPEAFTFATRSGFVEKKYAHFIAARLNDLLADLNVKLLRTIASFSRLAKGVYFCPFVTKSQWISSASTSTRFFRQISPSVIKSCFVQTLPVGFCGLHRISVLVS